VILTIRDPAALTVDDLRHLVRWCDVQRESWWRPVGADLTLAQILSLYHAANDAGYPGMDEWWSEDREAALTAFAAVRP